VLGWALVALGRRTQEEGEGTFADAGLVDTPEAGFETQPVVRVRARRRTRRKRLATSLAFATLFFAGAALSAGAGDMLVGSLEPSATDGDTTTTTETTDDPGTGDEAPASEDPAEAPTEEPPATEEPAPTDDGTPDEGTTPEDPADPGDTTEPGETTDPADPAEPGDTPDEGAPAGNGGGTESGGNGGGDGGKGNGGHSAPAPKGPPVVTPHEHADDEHTAALDPEAGVFGGATVWLHRTLPDPTPPARRLAPRWAKMLRTEANAAGTTWARVLAAVRANGHLGRKPVARSTVRTLANRLAATAGRGEWNSFLAFSGRTTWADKAQAFARYNRAVGLHALVVGLDASKRTLEKKVLNDRRLFIYAGGRSDVAAHGIDVRVLVLLRYMAEAHGTVTVSSLHSGHRYYSRPGVVSAHTYGLAVDIAALGGTPIYGNSEPGGLTEDGVRNVLLLPAELRPRQVISLLGLGGPSFPLADHDDHIHVGF
jgi:hypothetical protein